MEVASLSLALELDTLEELERAFAPRVGEGVVFLPGLEQPLVGAVVSASVTTRAGEVALSLRGPVAWRYPADAVPLGREAGVAVLVEECSEEHRARLERMRSLQDAGTATLAPGAGLRPTLRGPRPRAPVDEPRVERSRSLGLDDGFEIRSSDFVLAEHEGRLLQKRPGEEDAGAPRPLPSPPGFPQGPIARPTLTGAAFVYTYDEEKPPLTVKKLETFEWPEVGTLKPSREDKRTWAPGKEPPGDLYDDYKSPWDDVTDGERARHTQVELSDPAARVTDVVSSAVADMADVDDALASSSRREPLHVRDEADVENTETDARGLATESSDAPATALPMGLRVRVDDEAAEELFASGLAIPTAITRTLTRGEGRAHVKVAVFEGADEGSGQHLGTVSVKVPKGRERVDVRFQIDAEGFLEVRSHDDPSVRDRFRASWAAPIEYPKPRAKRGFLRRLFGL